MQRSLPGPWDRLLRAQSLAALVFIAISIYVYAESRGFPNVPWRAGGSPGFYPQMLAGMLAVLAVFLLIEGLNTPGTPILPDRSKWLLYLYVVACLILMVVWMLPYLGFRAAAAVFLFLVMWGIEGWPRQGRKLLGLVFFAVLIMLAVYAAFAMVANVRLPRGVIF